MMSGPAPHQDRAGVRLTDLGYRIGGQDILIGLETVMPASGITAVIGPNGAGKTTLLRLLHGMISPSLGRIHWPEAAAQTGLLLQRPVLLRRSVRANLRFAMTMAGSKPDRDEEDRLLALAGLSDKADHPARRLSGGEQQRLALIREVALKPAMLLMD